LTHWTNAQSRRAINLLRDGVPPEPAIAEWLRVGQSTLLQGLDAALSEALAGASVVRFIAGDPGFGKSHFLATLRFRAARRRSLISYSSQNLAAGITLNWPGAVYERIVSSLELPDQSRSTDAISTVLEAWSNEALKVTTYSKSSTYSLIRTLADRSLLPDINTIHFRTRVTLAAYLAAKRQNNARVVAVMLSVLRGLAIQSGDIAREAEQLGIEKPWTGYTPNKYDAEYWFGQLGVLCHIARAVNYGALTVMLDELESLVALRTAPSRAKAYRVLDSLFSRSYHTPGLLLIFAYTPAFLRGVARDYDAYGDAVQHSWRELVAQNSLQVSPLSVGDAADLLQRLAELYGNAEGWDADGALASFGKPVIAQWSADGGSARDLVKTAIHRFDLSAPE